jgi:hypothetical protein
VSFIGEQVSRYYEFFKRLRKFTPSADNRAWGFFCPEQNLSSPSINSRDRIQARRNILKKVVGTHAS